VPGPGEIGRAAYGYPNRQTPASRIGKPAAGWDPPDRIVALSLSTQTSLIDRLRGNLAGRVISPSDADYDEARTVFSGAIDRRPAAIARVADASDVSSVISVARETGLELAVRGGGHSGAGHGVSEGGLVLDLAELRELEIDPEERTAWAGGGLTAGEYVDSAGAHGLATGFGDAGSVGIGGLTLGGGVGYLSRKHGLTADHLLAAEVVTADGRLLRADADTHPDLFWAIRGGGGNFGVVTRFKYRLHPVEEFVGGTLVLPANPDVIASFVAEAVAAPDELSTIANVMPAPPLPFLSNEEHGNLVVMATLAYAGDVASAERAIAPFRSLAKPLADLVRPMPYPEIYPPDDPDFHPIATSRTLFVDATDRWTAELIVDQLQNATAPRALAQLRVLGGAVARVAADTTAYPHRDRRMIVNVAALHDGNQVSVHEAWVDGFFAALRQGETGAYVNFLGNEGPARVREAYPGSTWDRLTAVKARYDPANVFRLNQNVQPQARGVQE
jgi:FAD/FMN-containing dehydrogenase